jgi:hypothetical protein
VKAMALEKKKSLNEPVCLTSATTLYGLVYWRACFSVLRPRFSGLLLRVLEAFNA